MISIWEFPKIRSLHSKDRSILGSNFGPPILGNSHMEAHVHP